MERGKGVCFPAAELSDERQSRRSVRRLAVQASLAGFSPRSGFAGNLSPLPKAVGMGCYIRLASVSDGPESPTDAKSRAAQLDTAK